MKTNRREKISELITQHDIETQQELVDRLQASGYNVTQATVSREIRGMRLTKETGMDGRQRYRLPENNSDIDDTQFLSLFRSAFVSMEVASNMLVIKTHSGMAMALCAVLDQEGLREIVGSVAGDDTILACTHSQEDALLAKEKLRRIIERV